MTLSEYQLEYPVWQSALWCGLATLLSLGLTVVLNLFVYEFNTYGNFIVLLALVSLMTIMISGLGVTIADSLYSDTADRCEEVFGLIAMTSGIMVVAIILNSFYWLHPLVFFTLFGTGIIAWPVIFVYKIKHKARLERKKNIRRLNWKGKLRGVSHET